MLHSLNNSESSVELVLMLIGLHIQGVPKKERHFKYINKIANN